MIEDIFDNPEALDELEKMRDDHLLKAKVKRMTFLCYHTRVEGGSVRCTEFPLSIYKEGTMPLLAVLRGRTSLRCKTCKKYNA